MKLFYTANFADTFSPVTVLLYDGELTSGVALEHARCLGRVGVHLFDNEPEMPTLRDMHRIVVVLRGRAVQRRMQHNAEPDGNPRGQEYA